MANSKHTLRYFVLAALLILGLVWSIASADPPDRTDGYPNSDLLATAKWLKQHANDEGLIIVDVRTDEHFDDRLIPGAIRLPWSTFRYNNTATNEGSLFVGVARAQEILGRYGIGRTHRIVLYDSVARDGGATAAYLFWILDILGHDEKKILEGGLDAWVAAGYELASTHRELTPILYQAPMQEIHGWALIEGDDVYRRLGDRCYQIIDVRSPAEYKGEKGTLDLQGNGLKLGHIPTSININYVENWQNPETKLLKNYKDLQALYRGLNPERPVIVYCNSGRRSSFSYYVLRLMGIDGVCTYEASWKQWGNPANFFPVETTVNVFTGGEPPGASSERVRPRPASVNGPQTAARKTNSSGDSKPQSGYVSCGG